jgi:hypothetical protein
MAACKIIVNRAGDLLIIRRRLGFPESKQQALLKGN